MEDFIRISGVYSTKQIKEMLEIRLTKFVGTLYNQETKDNLENDCNQFVLKTLMNVGLEVKLEFKIDEKSKIQSIQIETNGNPVYDPCILQILKLSKRQGLKNVRAVVDVEGFIDYSPFPLLDSADYSVSLADMKFFINSHRDKKPKLSKIQKLKRKLRSILNWFKF